MCTYHIVIWYCRVFCSLLSSTLLKASAQSAGLSYSCAWFPCPFHIVVKYEVNGIYPSMNAFYVLPLTAAAGAIVCDCLNRRDFFLINSSYSWLCHAVSSQYSLEKWYKLIHSPTGNTAYAMHWTHTPVRKDNFSQVKDLSITIIPESHKPVWFLSRLIPYSNWILRERIWNSLSISYIHHFTANLQKPISLTFFLLLYLYN